MTSVPLREHAAMSPLKTLGTFLLLFLFISPNICSAASLADFSVASLPGLEALPHANHAGFIPVDAFGKGNLFFWLVSSKVADANTAKRPLILWLQGGPICSSSFALFLEHGPYRVLNVNATEESAVLGLREINWIDTAGADVLYLDQPLGAGYSVPDSEADWARNESAVAANVVHVWRSLCSLCCRRGSSTQ